MITNLRNLPLPIVSYIENATHISKGSNIGASSISAPARQLALLKKYGGELTEDAADRIWQLVGSAIHEILFQAAKDANPDRRKIDDALALVKSLSSADYGDPNDCDTYLGSAISSLEGLQCLADPEPQPFRTFAEERWEIEVGGWRVAARCDLLTLDNDEALTDYKVSSVWSVKEEKAKSDWIAQLNSTRYCGTRAIGIRPKKLQATVICRDWRMNERKKYPQWYPEVQIATVPVPMWSDDECLAYISERVRIHQRAQSYLEAGGSDDALPECTAVERWEKPVTYAVMKLGNKKATKVFPGAGQLVAATDFAFARNLAGKGNFEVQTRPGESPRCADYCPVLDYCNQGKRILAELAPPPEPTE